MSEEAKADIMSASYRNVRHKWLGSMGATIEDQIGPGLMVQILQTVERRRGKTVYTDHQHKTMLAAELRKIRKVYDGMEDPNGSHEMWRWWKGVRNVITDRIEEITGGRV